jgi:hypothetical protein
LRPSLAGRSFQSRLLVFIRWSLSFVTRGRGARLIAEAPADQRVISG